MSIIEGLREALDSLLANLLRSALTMLGIVIGVAAVIALVSIGQGVQELVTEQLQNLGSNLLYVLPGSLEGGPSGLRTSSSTFAGATSPTPLTNGDARALANPSNVPHASLVVPGLIRVVEVTYKEKSHTTQVLGTTPEYTLLRTVEPVEGQFLSPNQEGSRAVVLGPRVAEKLFPAEQPIVGETVKINGISFQVIGVLAPQGGTGFANLDDLLYIPLQTAQERLFRERDSRGELVLSTIYVQAANEQVMEETIEEVAETLRREHGIIYSADDDFTIISQEDVVAVFGEITGILTVFLGAIAAISLLVGGIGIMNIMLVSVTERTREIGIRKAVGARRQDILFQFLVEAVTLSLAGGIVGILLGGLGAGAITYFVPDLVALVSPQAVLLAAGFSVAVGLFFGIYPALRASRLDPIVALRYE
ncbi:MAG: ABC transporter permease [Chloroflexi bacterium]|nr:ABC transporter permease [Chloroflexota bacterium]